MTFVFCTQAVQGGAWKRLVEAIEHLSGEGHRCHLIAYSNSDLRSIREKQNVFVHEVRVPDERRSSLRFAVHAYSVLRRIEFEKNKKIWCGSFSGNSGLALSLFKYTASRPVSVFSFRRGAQLEKLKMKLDKSGASEFTRKIKVLIHKVATKIQLKSSDILILQTEVGLEKVKDDYPNSIPQHVYVVPNNINAKWIDQRREDAEEVKPDVEDDQFHVCFVGRFKMEKKGVDTLLEAASLLWEDPIVFDLVGDGHDVGEARSYVRDHGLEKSVRFHGWMENPLRVMKAADLVVVPSRTDPLPNVALEALALGTPVIGSNVDGIPVMLNFDDLLFEAGDARRMAALIQRASTDSEHYEAISEKCQERASEYRFDWGKKFESIFAESPSEDTVVDSTV